MITSTDVGYKFENGKAKEMGEFQSVLLSVVLEKRKEAGFTFPQMEGQEIPTSLHPRKDGQEVSASPEVLNLLPFPARPCE